MAFVDYQHVPVFRGPEEPWDLALRLRIDTRLSKTVFAQNPIDQLAEPVHLFAAGHGRPAAAVHPDCLLVGLGFERAPVVGNGFSETVFEVRQNDGHPAANHGS